MTVFDTICWPVCFFIMHRLSVRQNFLLKQLQEQGKRIEQLSKIEHDLIREVHPQVSQIKEELDEVAGNVKADPSPSAKQ
jgi:hypothetical protein